MLFAYDKPHQQIPIVVGITVREVGLPRLLITSSSSIIIIRVEKEILQ